MMKKINKYLNKKIYIGEALGDGLFAIVFIVFILILNNVYFRKNYEYEDIYSHYGKSDTCYVKKDKMYCLVEREVEWYGW